MSGRKRIQMTEHLGKQKTMTYMGKMVRVLYGQKCTTAAHIYQTYQQVSLDDPHCPRQTHPASH